MTSTLNVGLAGLGRFGSLHAKVLAAQPGVELAAICDPDAEQVERVGDQHDVGVRCQSVEELLEVRGIDCVYIVTPEEFHEDHVEAAIDRGVPIFLEKPLAMSATKGQDIADRARESGVYLQIGFVLRFEARHALVQQIVSSGQLGELITIRAKRNCSRAWFDVYGDRAHSVHETIVHDIDFVQWIVGEPCISVYAADRNYSGKIYPDACVAMLTFERGTIATLDTSWFVPAQAPANVVTDEWFGTIDAELEIVGTEQSIRLRLLESGMEIWSDQVTQHPELGLWPETRGTVGGALEAEDRYFVERVRRGDEGGISSIDDAVAGMRIAEAIIASAQSGMVVDPGK